MQKRVDRASANEAGSVEGSKVWIFPDPEKLKIPASVFDAILEITGGDRTIAELLVARGIDSEAKAKEFLDVDSYKPTSPMELPDVDKAVRRITEAIHKKEHITIYGDYDVDGITGTSVLLSVLRKIGADVDYYIPHRMSEGYGLNLKAVSVLASKRRTRLIITCDCGVSNFAEINFAKSLGVDCLVLDHHTMPEMLPPASGIVHPKLLPAEHPLFDLPGVGVAYKVCEALLIERDMSDEVDSLLDLVTMGMIADLVPLVRENRYLVKTGLPRLVATQRIGLKELLKQVASQTSTDLVGFGLAPRLNAAGRLSDANKAVELLTTDDKTVAEELANELQKENARRQELCEEIFAAADERVRKTVNLTSDKCIAIYDSLWHHGVVGIVASRLVDKYHRPVFIGQLDTEEGVVKGSARGIQQIDLYEVLKDNEHMLTKWGGHKMAAGFSVEAERADELMKALVATANKMLVGKSLAGIVELDLVVAPELVDLFLVTRLGVLAPFGMGNKKPRLCMKSLTCVQAKPLGKEGKHARIMLSMAGITSEFECVKWNSQGRMPEPGQVVDIVFTPEVNHFNGRDRLQLILSDWRPHFSGKEYISIEEHEANTLKQAVASADNTQLPFQSTEEAVASDIISGISNTKLEKLVEDVQLPLEGAASRIASVKVSWRDLRGQESPKEVLSRATQKLGDKLIVFGESTTAKGSFTFVDRTTWTKSKHLLIWQIPPSIEVFQEMLKATSCENLYLLGVRDDDFDEPTAFLKRLFGLVRYAVNQKGGEIHGEKLTALMGATKLSTALGLSVLKRVNLIDWFAQDAIVHLDLLGVSLSSMEDCPEFAQLSNALCATMKFRDWISKARTNDIQLEFVKNVVSLPRKEEDQLNSEEDYGSRDRKIEGQHSGEERFRTSPQG
ncbi:MAG: single-stranded-DNA-specific exonuclease RecJ [Candidatus Obscuribacterales bacterium]|nr:single-stranded-DNA-specific exonuclease RecJ [Candidatus Obscuribacterales bacterium]